MSDSSSDDTLPDQQHLYDLRYDMSDTSRSRSSSPTPPDDLIQSEGEGKWPTPLSDGLITWLIDNHHRYISLPTSKIRQALLRFDSESDSGWLGSGFTELSLFHTEIAQFLLSKTQISKTPKQLHEKKSKELVKQKCRYFYQLYDTCKDDVDQFVEFREAAGIDDANANDNTSADTDASADAAAAATAAADADADVDAVTKVNADADADAYPNFTANANPNVTANTSNDANTGEKKADRRPISYLSRGVKRSSSDDDDDDDEVTVTLGKKIRIYGPLTLHSASFIRLLETSQAVHKTEQQTECLKIEHETKNLYEAKRYEMEQLKVMHETERYEIEQKQQTERFKMQEGTKQHEIDLEQKIKRYEIKLELEMKQEEKRYGIKLEQRKKRYEIELEQRKKHCEIEMEQRKKRYDAELEQRRKRCDIELEQRKRLYDIELEQVQKLNEIEKLQSHALGHKFFDPRDEKS
ncbi:hypothetical protein BGZ65_000616 [Modicella reniformis]|uniref:Uncharacterized protein n=1 Tax=Modicella reniformis TaxID=1440133 RepID=A0A9P6ILW8_9FUNG|nr:hypothetical protein BGZ65_000616 [Modicella reniformis]